MTNQDQGIESAIAAAGANVAPRIKPADIEANIHSEFYFSAANGIHKAAELAGAPMNFGRDVFPPAVCLFRVVDGMDVEAATERLTFCVLVLRNGFTVTGESACASPENFNAEIGRRIARENAVAKIWPLMGYLLRQCLHEEAQRPVMTLADSLADLSGTPRPDHPN